MVQHLSCPSSSSTTPEHNHGTWCLSDSDSDSSCGGGPSPIAATGSPSMLRAQVATYCGIATDEVHLLGSGNSGVVFSARLKSSNDGSVVSPPGTLVERNAGAHDEPVAVKVVASTAHSKREVAALQTCAGLPHVPKLMRFETNFGNPDHPGSTTGTSKLLAVELLGPDLFELTDRFRLNEGELLCCGLAMLDALAGLHRLGLVHKSVKPENFCFCRPTKQLTRWRHRTSSSPHRRRRTSCSQQPSTRRSTDAHQRSPLLKIIDFGRCEPQPLTAGAVQTYEKRFTGWWYSINGLLGRPQGPADDLMSLVYSLGFLIDDAELYDDAQPLPVVAVSPSNDDQQKRRPSFTGLRKALIAEVEVHCEAHEDQLRNAQQAAPCTTEPQASRDALRRMVADEGMQWYAQRREEFHKRFLNQAAVPQWWKTLAYEVEGTLLLQGASGVPLAAGSVDELTETVRSCLTCALDQWKQVNVKVRHGNGGIREEIEQLVRRYVGEHEASRKRPHSE